MTIKRSPAARLRELGYLHDPNKVMPTNVANAQAMVDPVVGRITGKAAH